MRILLFLFVPLFIAGVVIGFSVWRNRRPQSMEAGMREFQRGLNALDPKNAPTTSRRPTTPPSTNSDGPGAPSGPSSSAPTSPNKR